MKYKLKSFFLVFTLIYSGLLISQNGSSIKLILVDSTSKSAIEFATVSLTRSDQTTALKYALTDNTGRAEITNIPNGNYSVKVEYMGYATIFRTLEFSSNNKVDLGILKMKEQVNTLGAVTVSAIGNPIVVKKDTIEYNADSFKTTDADVLETLLKKLPGIEVDSDGKITANGKTINKIMIDGKMFFLDDPTIASKNLPAKIIEKVRVVERKSEQAQFTGIDDGNEETVIDLGIRGGMLNGLLGNISGGYGTEERFQTAGMLAKFTKTDQLAFFVNGNNTNNRGFQDMAGDMMRSSRSSFGGGSFAGGGGGIRIGGMNFGGNGLTTSWMTGTRLYTESKDGKLKIGGNYIYTSNDNLIENSTLRQTFIGDSSFFYNQKSMSSSISQGHRASMEVEYAFNDKTSILFRPNANIGYGSFNERREYNSYENFNNSYSELNSGEALSFGNNNNQQTNGTLLFRHRLGKPGRTFSVNATYSLSKNETVGYNQSQTVIGLNPVSEIDQQYLQNSNSYGFGARASYTEPLGKNFYSELAYSYNYSKTNSEKETYNNSGSGYDELVDQYSTQFENLFIRQQLEFNVRKNEEKYNYVIGVNAQPSYTKSIGTERNYERSVINFAPSARYEYNFSDVQSLRLNYRGSTNQPSISQLQPVADNSNPLYQAIGNPDLLPEFRHSIEFSYRDTKKEVFRTYEARLNANYIQDKIINKTWYENGIQYTQPVNEQGVYNANGFFMYSTPFSKTSKFFISTTSRAGINKGVNYLGSSFETTNKNKTTTYTLGEQLRLIYKGKSLELNVGGNASFSRAMYSLQASKSTSTWTNSVIAFFNWTLPQGFNLVSDLDYKFYLGFSEDIDPSAVWNAELSKTVLKNVGTLRVKIYDILNQAKNLYRTTNDSYIEDTQVNILKQYVMFSFTIRFGKFDGMQGRGFMPGGGHGGFRPGGMRMF